MRFIKRNYGWIIVAILSILPLVPILNLLLDNFPDGSIQSNAESTNLLNMLYHISGEFAIRWMTAVLTLTPFFILFGVTNLFVRQAMGISTAVWSLIHFFIFIWGEGFLKTFSQVNYILGLIAVLILIPLLITSNRKSMKWLNSKWKKLQRLVYLAVSLSILHIVLLDKTWLIYTIIIGIGFVIRIPAVTNKIVEFRLNRKKVKI